MDKDTYDRPEPREQTANRGWAFILGALAVIVVLVAMATGVGR